MTDRRPGQVASHCDRLTNHLQSITLWLQAHSTVMSQLPTPARPERLVKPPGTSDPTGGIVTGGEQTLTAHLNDWLALIADLHRVASQLGHTPTHNLDAWVTANDPTLTPQAGTTRWRSMVADLGRHATLTVHALHQAWQDAYQARHTTESGLQVLDEMADLQLTVHVDRIRHLTRTARTLQRRLAPAGTQKPLIYCTNHPDRLAKYRGLELCGACYQRQQKTA